MTMHSKLDLDDPRNWLQKDAGFFLAAGPCSAESKQQLLSVAQSLNDIQEVSYFRCGIWKPRTQPGGFEGMGETALKWLGDVKERFPRLKIIVEVARPEHIELCKNHSVDAVWLGARTTVNPFLVQELADVLKDTHYPVFVKNPVAPDLRLWIGAFERLNRAGIRRLVAIHRGFTPTEKGLTRNDPVWKIPYELKGVFPNLPIICDPSHISGKSELVFPVAQSAITRGFGGLMIEVHCDPKNAMSDKEQQITPTELTEALKKFEYPSKSSPDPNFQMQISLLREEIDQLDYRLLLILSERLSLVKKIGALKKKNKITPLQIDRWQHLVQQRREQAKELQLNPALIEEVFNLIHAESLEIQNKERDLI